MPKITFLWAFATICSRWPILAPQMAFPLFFLGFLFGGPLLMDIGIMLFAAALLFQVVTLPVEYNASSRAMQLLEGRGLSSSR